MINIVKSKVFIFIQTLLMLIALETAQPISTAPQAQDSSTTKAVQIQSGEKSPQKLPEGSEKKGEKLTLIVNVDGVGKFKDGMVLLANPNENLKMNLSLEGESPTTKFSGESGEKNATKFSFSTTEELQLDFSDGKLLNSTNREITFKTPEKPGSHKICFKLAITQSLTNLSETPPKKQDISSVAALTLNILVGYLFNPENRGVVEGYPVGIYPDEGSPSAKSIIAEHRENYHPPKYFFKVTAETQEWYLSEHFKLNDFTSLSERGKDRFIALSHPLVYRLEQVQSLLIQKNLPKTKIKIIRGFLSPNEIKFFKKKGVKLLEFSRYQYGDAAAIIVDENNDGILDDLNNDGQVNVADAKALEDIVKEVEKSTRIYGGLGVYEKFEDPNSPDTPYVHLDLRGFSSQW